MRNIYKEDTELMLKKGKEKSVVKGVSYVSCSNTTSRGLCYGLVRLGLNLLSLYPPPTVKNLRDHALGAPRENNYYRNNALKDRHSCE